MDPILKQRLVGVIVLTFLAAIFIPMLLDEPKVMPQATQTNIEIPKFPEKQFAEKRHSIETYSSSALAKKPTAKWQQSYPRKADDTKDGPKQQSYQTKAEQQPAIVTTPKPAIVAKPKKVPAKVAKQAKPVVKPLQKKFSRWFIQVGSFTDKKNATIFMKKLRQRKFSSFVETARSGQGFLYRVKVGPELNEVRATMMLNKIEKMFGVEAVLLTEFKNL
ncbi:MAG: SPOR domain-containing protein [Methylococcaceae bacterium]